eukprot:scpid85757/ scgid18951/ Mediator of RNA polymerase II transcription subunit 31; Mediator complex subunit 31; Mediator complex subunit soh1
MEGVNLSADASTSRGDAGNVVGQNDEELRRFQVELEFLQCLANPFYLNHLAQHGYMDKKEFVNYLKYLLYWKQPEYAIFIKYPACLHILELLQEETFRKELISPLCAKFVEEQLLLHWQYYAFRRQMAGPVPPGAVAGQAAAITAEGEPMQPLQPHQQSASVITNGLPSVTTPANGASSNGS